ncbi:lipopolysaccharide biosynthesis protein [Arthrobacter sp. CAN_A1]|uniref:lipopolysaccharide biosynthesis protein n=1 Tax=Arthrobacter sp. CAN_A1 TaxID=2787717 RepID=UPI002FD44403
MSGVRWSLLAVLARQSFQILCAIVIARILGPESYGIVSVASIYIVFVTLLLDQGLSAALVQRPNLSLRAPGAVFTLNLLMAFAIGGATWAAAPLLADFFRVGELTLVLQILALAVPIKAIGIAPRAMLSRGLQFRGIAVSDISGAATGAALGIGAALLGAGYFSVIYQVVATDLIVGIILLVCSRGPWPNYHLGEVRPLLAFSLGVFATNGLAYFSRNVDNILVGRFLGVTSLSLYSMAYRILVVPVQLVGQTVNRVMFPAFSRIAGNLDLVAENLKKSMQILSMVVIPAMAFVACSASPLVFLVLGSEWSGAAALISVLAIGGARETIFYITPSLMKGLGRSGLNLRYEIFATTLQVAGIVIGLQFGLLWVAVGYTCAGFLLVPVLLVIQSRLCGATVGQQLRIIWPPVHASLWASAGYLVLARFGLHPLLELLVGLLVFVVLALLVMIIFHRTNLRLFVSRAAFFVRSRGNKESRPVA